LKNLEEKAPMARTRQDIGKVFTPSTISYVVLYIYIWLAAIPKYIYGAVPCACVSPHWPDPALASAGRGQIQHWPSA
jgi:hypothetical protein